MHFISENNLAALIGTSNATVQRWGESGIYPSHQENGLKGFFLEELENIPEVKRMLYSCWDEELDTHPIRKYTSIELFAGCGGLALGLSMAGFTHVLLNEYDHSACNTLRVNRPEWNIIERDVCDIDFTPLRDKVDFLSGGFPCQAFSYAGKQGGFNDTRGTLFFELARAVKEIRPKVFMGENVKGLISHDNGRTFNTIKNTIAELGYTLVEPRVLKAVMYQVPQKRERLILIAIRNDLAAKVKFHWPSPYTRVLTLKDAFYKGLLYDVDVPVSEGSKYPIKKQKILDLVPQGGDWRNLPEEVAKEYLGGSWFLGGGKTGMARRLSLNEPSLTLTCSPCQKQTERCHPLETRPLTVREYARIQTFPDNWLFTGTMNDKYKQIGLWLDSFFSPSEFLKTWGAWLHIGLDKLGYPKFAYNMTVNPKNKLLFLSEEELLLVDHCVQELNLKNAAYTKILLLRYEKRLTYKQIAKILDYKDWRSARMLVDKIETFFGDKIILRYAQAVGKSDQWVSDRVSSYFAGVRI